MRQKNKLLGFYNYTVILTYIGMLSGFLGIAYVCEDLYTNAIICLMVAGFCDMFDGAIASTMQRTRQEKCFGIQIDSLSDLICFGVLPSLLVYRLSGSSWFSFVIAGLYALCALIRLAYFNVDEQERQAVSSGAREVYLGLPVTMSALLIPLAYGICNYFDYPSAGVLRALLLCIGCAFVLPIPLKKPRILGKAVVLLCGMLEVALLAALRLLVR